MASLRHPNTGELILLSAPTRIGRSADNQIVLDEQWVSRSQAVLLRADGLWHLRALSAHCSTRLNGRVVGVNESCVLRKGDRMRFGHDGSDPKYDWVLSDDSPPQSFLAKQGGQVLLQGQRTPLYDSTGGLAAEVLARPGHGGAQEYWLKCKEAERALENGAVFALGGEEYRAVLVEELPQTEARAGAGPVLLRLHVSSCEDAIQAELECAGVCEPLKLSSNRAELVLRLAEQRLDDTRKGVPPLERGYTGELTRLLNQDAGWVNTYCYRINLAAAQLNLLHGPLIHWDAQTGQRRLQVDEVEIVRVSR